MPLRPLGHLSSFSGTLRWLLRPSRWGGPSQARPPRRDTGTLRRVTGGESGSRTHVGLAPKPDFESGAFGHSAISPENGRIHIIGPASRRQGSRGAARASGGGARPPQAREPESRKSGAQAPGLHVRTPASIAARDRPL